MILQQTELQQLIASSAAEFLAAEYSFGQHTGSVSSNHGIDPRIWREFAGLGWLALPLAEDDGGIGDGLYEAGLVAHEMGCRLVVEPWLASVMLGTRLFDALAPEPVRSEWLPQLVAGDCRMAVTGGSVLDSRPPSRAQAAREGDFFHLSGSGLFAESGCGASVYLVPARLESQDKVETAVFLVPAATKGVSLVSIAALDGRRHCRVDLREVKVPAHSLLASGPSVDESILYVMSTYEILKSWEIAGAMSELTRITANYVQERRQFGRAIADFQAVQHRLAEMLVYGEEARAGCQLATLCASRDPQDALAQLQRLRIRLCEGARFVAQQAVQLHGGMGVSEETPVPAFFRKLMAFSRQGGGAHRSACDFYELWIRAGRWRESAVLPAVMDQRLAVEG